MRLHLFFILCPFLVLSQTQLGEDIDGENLNGYFGASISLSSSGNIVAVGAYKVNELAGQVKIYENNSGNWVQIGDDINGESPGDFLSYLNALSLSGDGNVVAVGAPNKNNGIGIGLGNVRVFKNIEGVWTQIGDDIKPDPLETSTEHTSKVSLSFDGNILAVGASAYGVNNSRKGKVKIYRNVLGNWTQIGDDIIGENDYDGLGGRLSISSDGSILAISGHNIASKGDAGGGSGFVKIYKNESDIWTQIGNTIEGELQSDNFAGSISISDDGSTVAAGAFSQDINGSVGKVKIYKIESDTWTQIGSTLTGEALYDNFGQSISLSNDGSIIAIGGDLNDGNGPVSGHVQIYKNYSGVWTQIGEDINGENSYDRSGFRLSLSDDGTIVAIGAFSNDDNGKDSGHVRIFSLSSDLAIHDVSNYLSGASNGINITANLLNNIDGVSGAINGVDYSTVLFNGEYSDRNSPTTLEIQVVINNVNNSLGTENGSLDSFRVYPNPTKDALNVKFNKGLELQQINVYNIQSQYLFSTKTSEINLSNLKNGMYFIEVETNQGKSAKKIVIE